jgi:predicted  nucleic acid-binding Zn-ribbon protein
MGLTLVNAQTPIEFTDDEVKFGNSQCPGVWVTIPEADMGTVSKDWKKLIEKGSKSKALVNNNEITIFGAMIKDISGATINVFSSVIGQDSVVRLFAAAELTRDVFAVSGTTEYESLKSVLKQFSKDQYISVAKDQLSAQEKILKEMEKDISSLRKDQEKLEKGLESANITISEETYKIATAENQLKETSTSLDAKNNELSNVSPDAKKALESEIKSLEKQQKSLEKDIASSGSKISKSKTVIEENNNALPVNLSQQDELGIKINEQRMVVSNYTQKLANIEAY